MQRETYKYSNEGKLQEQIIYKKEQIKSRFLYYYNENQLLIEEQHFNSKGDLTIKIFYNYDAKYNLIEKLSIDPNGGNFTYKWKYENGNMVEMTKYYPNGNIEVTTTFSYDKFGNQIISNCNSFNEKDYGPSYKHTTKYSYDENGKILKKTNYDENNNILESTAYEFDVDGNQIEMRMLDKNGLIEGICTDEYDENGNQIISRMIDANLLEMNKTINIYNQKSNKIESYSYVWGKYCSKRVFQYDDNSNLLLEQSYNYEGVLVEITKNEYDESNRIIETIRTKENFEQFHGVSKNKKDLVLFGSLHFHYLKESFVPLVNKYRIRVQIFNWNNRNDDLLTLILTFKAPGNEFSIETESVIDHYWELINYVDNKELDLMFLDTKTGQIKPSEERYFVFNWRGEFDTSTTLTIEYITFLNYLKTLLDKNKDSKLLNIKSLNNTWIINNFISYLS